MTENDKLYYKTCRENAGLTQEDAIMFLGVSDSTTLSRYENGHLTVSQDLVAKMVLLYRTPALVWWHLRYANPDLVQYMPELCDLKTDGDMAFQMVLADDEMDIATKLLKSGVISEDKIPRLLTGKESVKSIINQLTSIVTYIDSCYENSG